MSSQRPPVTREQLERLLRCKASRQDVVRARLRAEGLINESDPPALTERGREALQKLRQSLNAANDSTA